MSNWSKLIHTEEMRGEVGTSERSTMMREMFFLSLFVFECVNIIGIFGTWCNGLFGSHILALPCRCAVG